MEPIMIAGIIVVAIIVIYFIYAGFAKKWPFDK